MLSPIVQMFGAGGKVLAFSDLVSENFESYGTGALANGSTLTGGSGWSGAPLLNITGAASIGTRTFADGAKKCLSLANGEYIRRMAFSNSWNVLRIGVLWAQVPFSTSNLDDRLIFGVNSGATYGYGGGANTVNFVGQNVVGRSDFIGNTWHLGYFSGTNDFYNGNGGGSRFKKIGSTITELNGNANTVFTCPTTNGAGVQRRWAQFLQIAKGSPNYTLTWIYPTTPSLTAATDVTVTDFDTTLQTVSTTPTVNGLTYSNANQAGSGAASEAAGILDALSIYNDLSTYPIEIYKVAAYRFS